jgi:hypothetical protein
MLWYKKAQPTGNPFAKSPLPRTLPKNKEGRPSFADPKGAHIPPPTPAENLAIIQEITRALHDASAEELAQLRTQIQAGGVRGLLGQAQEPTRPEGVPSMQVGPRRKEPDAHEPAGTPAIEHLRRTLPGTAPPAKALPGNRELTDQEKRRKKLQEGRPWQQ